MERHREAAHRAATSTRFPQFYDPTANDTPANAAEADGVLGRLPGPGLRGAPPANAGRWRPTASAHEQDEYCEWTVERNGAGKITRVTFTTEVPEYWAHLFELDLETLLELYRELVGVEVDPGGSRSPTAPTWRNKWNDLDARAAPPTSCRQQQPRRSRRSRRRTPPCSAVKDGVSRSPTSRSWSGAPARRAAAQQRSRDRRRRSTYAAGPGNEITLADPPGLYLGRPLTAGMITPDGADAAPSGASSAASPPHPCARTYEVPAGSGYAVGDIKVNGPPIGFGGQLADRVQVWVTVTIKPASHKPKPKPCGVE